jgi:hypothetical protein
MSADERKGEQHDHHAEYINQPLTSEPGVVAELASAGGRVAAARQFRFDALRQGASPALDRDREDCGWRGMAATRTANGASAGRFSSGSSTDNGRGKPDRHILGVQPDPAGDPPRRASSP